MKPFTIGRQRGASLLELAVAAVVTALLAGLLLNCLISYREESEHVAAKQLIGSLRTALAIQSAKIISTTGEAGLLALAHQNPMTWLQQPPKNYLGEYYSPNKAELPSGNWYFDRVGQTLIYLGAAEKSFSVGIQKILIFKVKLVHMPGPINTDALGKGGTGLVLDQLSDSSVAIDNTAGSISRLYFSEKK
jgi:type II secretory pathway pseudopilin PulG